MVTSPVGAYGGSGGQAVAWAGDGYRLPAADEAETGGGGCRFRAGRAEDDGLARAKFIIGNSIIKRRLYGGLLPAEADTKSELLLSRFNPPRCVPLDHSWTYSLLTIRKKRLPSVGASVTQFQPFSVVELKAVRLVLRSAVARLTVVSS